MSLATEIAALHPVIGAGGGGRQRRLPTWTDGQG
jgi:hypothetical protein